MDYKARSRTFQAINKDVENGKCRFDHKLQRKQGQWSLLQKSELIDSIFRNFPIDSVRAEELTDEKGNKTYYIFDGVQRISTVCSFINNKFALSKTLSPVTVDGTTYDISGKKFKDLEEILQDKITNEEIRIVFFWDLTDDDRRLMFKRQNNGKVLTNTQKRTAIESDALSQKVFELASHPFFNKVLTKTQIKRDIARDIIRETFMLIETNAENDYTSFRATDIDKFVLLYDNGLDDEKISLLRIVLDKLDEAFEEKVKIAYTSLPMIFYAGYTVLKYKKSFSRFIEIVNDFILNYDSNEEYKQYLAKGTTSTENVRGRFNYWKNLIKNI